MKRLILLIAFIFTTGCSATEVMSYEDYFRETLELSSRMESSPAWSDLFLHDQFRRMFLVPEQHFLYAQMLVADAKAIEEQKMIAIYSIQGIPLEEYLEFLRHVVSLARSDLLSSRLMEKAIFPSYQWNTLLAEHYQNPSVVGFLQLVRQVGGLSESAQKRLSLIESGEACEDVQELRSSGQIP
jgi:hypothetical protein